MNMTHTKIESWKTEPDQVEWVDPTTKLPCLLRRSHAGSWCGYVGLPKGHPWWSVHYSDEDFADPQVHGGVTFTGHLSADFSAHMLHKMLELGLIPDELWWVGFDCNHWGDYAPNDAYNEGTYRTVDYATAELVNLALQAKVAK